MSEIVQLSCSTLQSSGALCIKAPKLEVFESFQSFPPGRRSGRDTNHSLGRGVTVTVRVSQPSGATSQPPHLSTSLIILHCPGTDAFKCNGPNQETHTLRSKTNGKMCSHSDTVHKEAQSWMRAWARETEHLPPSPYNELQSISQAQNDNRIQLTSNGFTAHINLSLCGVTNDLTPSVRMEFIIAHCSMCCDAHIVNGTLFKSVRNFSLQNKLAIHPDITPMAKHVS